jgi:2,4-dienoyl-CoA reductase-like NADH-dependent reductase (Old Yellow Enzyme family)
MVELTHMFAPLRIRDLTMRNRFMVSPMVMNYCSADGMVTETYLAYHEERAKGGWGLIVTEDCAIDPAGRLRIGGLWNDSQIAGQAELTRRVHAHGAAIIAQIYHSGRQSKRAIIYADTVAPTAITCPHARDAPRVETRGGGADRGAVRRSALRARRPASTGEIHGGLWLPGLEFASLLNKRFDKYRGSLWNRARSRWRSSRTFERSGGMISSSSFASRVTSW